MMVGRYHIVIDANVREASNAILKHHGLFQLPNLEDGKVKRHKDRGAYKLELTEEMKMKLNKQACVEKMLHAAMQTRMASLYEQATGEQCIFKNETCIGRMEEEELKSNWIF